MNDNQKETTMKTIPMMMVLVSGLVLGGCGGGDGASDEVEAPEVKEDSSSYVVGGVGEMEVEGGVRVIHDQDEDTLLIKGPDETFSIIVRYVSTHELPATWGCGDVVDEDKIFPEVQEVIGATFYAGPNAPRERAKVTVPMLCRQSVPDWGTRPNFSFTLTELSDIRVKGKAEGHRTDGDTFMSDPNALRYTAKFDVALPSK